MHKTKLQNRAEEVGSQKLRRNNVGAHAISGPASSNHHNLGGGGGGGGGVWEGCSRLKKK